ncbi:MAG: metallophosphoesterase [Halobacteriales archaeon]|nr:metallophosphoesterase [Halobacteriales archaeon]
MPTAAEPFGVVRDRAVYLPESECLIAADLHLGKAAASAVDAPLDGGPAMVQRLAELVDRFEPAELVLAGDVLHAFGFVPEAARDALDDLAERTAAADAELVLVEGNHDTLLGSLTDIEPTPAHGLADGTIVCHGHEYPERTGERYVVGHDHPVIEIEGRRRPCYLYGAHARDGAAVLGLPSFNPAVRGTAVNRWADGDPLSPFLSTVTDFQPVVWDADANEPLVFPPLGSLQAYL